MPSRAVVWFRRDLRTADHPALLAALAVADQVCRCSWSTGPRVGPLAPERLRALEDALRFALAL
jgi:deoxyribodipyrimidine photolyase